MTIEKGVDQEFFEKILSGEKNFEIRLANFACQAGDEMILKEKDSAGAYTGREIKKQVCYVSKTGEMDFWPPEEIEKYGYQIIGFK